MRVVTLDWETYYATDYSLSKLSPLEYVKGDRFQVISCAIKVDNNSTEVFFGEERIRDAINGIRPILGDSLLIAHNMSGFDAYVCAYRFDMRPKMWGCTLAMARPIHAKTTGLSLGSLVEHYADELRAMGIASRKDNTVLVQTRGKRLEDFTDAELGGMKIYNRNDTDQCYGLFKVLRKHYTPAEMWQIDALIRMRTEPAFELDAPLLETAASVERSRKHESLLSLAKMLKLEGADWGDETALTERVRSELASSSKFAALLTQRGVEVPMKASPTNPDKQVPAMAKTDAGFLALQENDDPVVAAAARARLDVKSTLLETRIQKFLTAGALAGGRLPVPLRYCGADTSGRDSGEEYNMQNLPRIDPEHPKVTDALRNSLKAPKGTTIIVADQSGIELRVNHFLWKVPSSMALYQANPGKADLYKSFAADGLFMIPPEQVSKEQRRIAKLCQLGLQFGAGAATFQRIAKVMGGVNIPLNSREHEGAGLTAEQVVARWRMLYAKIVAGWKVAGNALVSIEQGMEETIDPWGLVHTCDRGFVLPSGRLIRYPSLRQEDDGEWPDGRPRTSWFYAHGRFKARITGPKSVENIVQALARDSIFDCSLDYFRLTGLRPALRVHDELVYVVPEKEADELLDALQGIMRTPPKWWPGLIVWSEGGKAKRYGDAK